ncbi:hypothetical protein CbuG_0010 [Coxiella burnetii CbuG_Q212]|nr:hypothetical protein CbuG_0010 [Coxiella burnetii CbuG_Q212]
MRCASKARWIPTCAHRRQLKGAVKREYQVGEKNVRRSRAQAVY